MHCSLYWIILFSNNSLGCGTLMYGEVAVGNEGWNESAREVEVAVCSRGSHRKRTGDKMDGK